MIFRLPLVTALAHVGHQLLRDECTQPFSVALAPLLLWHTRLTVRAFLVVFSVAPKALLLLLVVSLYHFVRVFGVYAKQLLSYAKTCVVNVKLFSGVRTQSPDSVTLSCLQICTLAGIWLALARTTHARARARRTARRAAAAGASPPL